MRISEAFAARVSALTTDRLVITRKGGKAAVIPLPEHTVEALRAMAGTTGTEIARGDEADRWLFATASGHPWNRTDAAKLLTRLAQKADITKKVSPHVLRHTHATLALELGVALHHLQDSLGHTDPRTTRRYDHTRSRLEQGCDEDVPRQRLPELPRYDLHEKDSDGPRRQLFPEPVRARANDRGSGVDRDGRRAAERLRVCQRVDRRCRRAGPGRDGRAARASACGSRRGP